MEREREIACLSLGKVTGPKSDTSLRILNTQIVREIKIEAVAIFLIIFRVPMKILFTIRLKVLFLQ